MIRVGFIINFKPSRWLGGFNYYKNLFQCLEKFSNNKIIPVIISDRKRELQNDEIISKLEIIETKLVSRSNILLKIINKILILIFNKNFYFDKFLQDKKILALSHSGWIGKKSKVLNFPWIPDFQELHLPENFTVLERIIRRLRVFFCEYYSTKILISSKSVRKDLEKISINAKKNSLLIKHTVEVPKYSELKSFKYLKKKYAIKKNYFFLPNHYWKHKNHFAVLKAITTESKYQIISTGNFSDYRHPKYIKKIKEYIIANKLNETYKILNVIPYIDMMSLMYYSMAVINPSKSEGWSNTVEQAKAMKKKIILSNIDVHIEQKNKYCIYFQPDNCNKLKMILNSEYKKFKNSKKKFDKNYYLTNNILKKNFAQNYENLIFKILKRKSKI